MPVIEVHAGAGAAKSAVVALLRQLDVAGAVAHPLSSSFACMISAIQDGSLTIDWLTMSLEYVVLDGDAFISALAGVPQ